MDAKKMVSSERRPKERVNLQIILDTSKHVHMPM
jgi:hypothetical protein